MESKKEDVYNEYHILTLKGSRNPAKEAYRAAHIANSSHVNPNSNSNPNTRKKGKNKKKGKKEASSIVKGQKYSAKSAEQASFMLGSYNLAIKEEEEDFNSSSNSSSSSDSDTQLAQLLASKGYKKRKDFKGKGLKTSSNNKAKYKDNQPRRPPRDPAFYNTPTPAKLAKITPAIRCMAACKAKQCKLAKACATAGRAVAAKRSNKDDNNAYNGAYMPPAEAEEEEEGGNSDNNGINSSTSDSTDKGKGSGVYKRGKGALRCKDTLPRK
ncbi:hypothetical protein P8C59_003117 [Phyllachora maydis]|uniref:Uncharacterized protein n=1 Tax=Phyllachora maydis TaxID=1825666 RepID=A0AAD9HZJ7_9PEZI|nr:hypothetical protein P8C59_003117 [Phyllachora maydis]